MTTQAPAASTSANPQTALQMWRPTVAELLPQGLTEDKVNLLVPSMAIRQVNPYLVPDLEMVQLSLEESKGDIYHSNDMKPDHWAPTARALSKIANVAGIDVLDSRRLDDGTDPDIVEWRVVIEMRLPSGELIKRSGTKRIDLHQMAEVTDRDGKPRSSAWLNKAREHLIANAETKAFNRAIRAVLSLQGSMPKAHFAKPFGVLRYVPNMADPDVRRQMLNNLLPATTAAYGPPDVVQIGPGSDAPEAPDDDEPVDGDVVDVRTNGTAKVDASTGEILSETSAEPDWFGEDGGGQDAAPTLVERLRRASRANADKAPALNEQKLSLKELLAGVSTEEVLHVMRSGLNFKGAELREITAGQAAAIIAVGAELGAEELRRQWVEAAS